MLESVAASSDVVRSVSRASFTTRSSPGCELLNAESPSRHGYATAHADVWDAEGRLVAFAAQTMMLRERRKKPLASG